MTDADIVAKKPHVHFELVRPDDKPIVNVRFYLSGN